MCIGKRRRRVKLPVDFRTFFLYNRSMEKNKLKDRQKEIVSAILDYLENTGYPPSVRDLVEDTSMTSTSVVSYHLKRLVEMGWLERDKNSARGLRLLRGLNGELLTDEGSFQETASMPSPSMVSIPLMGHIVASEPLYVPESGFSAYGSEDDLSIGVDMLPPGETGKDLYALIVDGDSMIDSYIADGDVVVIKPVTSIKNGDMAAVWIEDDNETTLKHVYNEGSHIRLQPANPSVPPITITDPEKVLIKGKVVMVVRTH